MYIFSNRRFHGVECVPVFVAQRGRPGRQSYRGFRRNAGLKGSRHGGKGSLGMRVTISRASDHYLNTYYVCTHGVLIEVLIHVRVDGLCLSSAEMRSSSTYRLSAAIVEQVFASFRRLPLRSVCTPERE